MKIRRLNIQNLGNLHNISLDGIDDLAVFVGRNGSGKTFLFSGLKLFFEEFQAIGGNSAVKDDDYIWYRRETSRNIIVELSLELSPEELLDIAKQCGLSEEELESESNEEPIFLSIKRELVFGRGWRTTYLMLGSKQVVEHDKVVSRLSPEPDQEPPDLSPWTLYIFSPDASRENISGPRLLVDSENKHAFHSAPEFDALVSTHGLAISEEYKGQPYEQWTTDQGIQYINSQPTQAQAPQLYEAIEHSSRTPGGRIISPSLSPAIQSAFRLIPVSRDSRDTDGLRPPMLDAQYSEAITELSISTEADDDTKWARFSGDVVSSLEKRLSPNPIQPLIEDKGLRWPLPFMGGGEQALIGLEWALLSGHMIYAIEEPEKHLHPELIKRLFSYLKGRADESEMQIFLSTHSHLLVDKANPETNWRFKIAGNKSTISHCESVDDLRTTLIDLGVVPSDMLFKDVVVFVEGGTEKLAVFPIWASKMGIDVGGTSNVGLVNIGGESRLKDNLRIWLEIAPNAPAEYLVVLDSHSAHLIAEIYDEMGIPNDRFVLLSKHGIEDYYPPKLIAEAFNALFNIDIESKEFHIRDGKSRSKKMKEILDKERKIENDWKIAIGQFVASRMAASDINKELKKLFRKIDRLRK